MTRKWLLSLGGIVQLTVADRRALLCAALTAVLLRQAVDCLAVAGVCGVIGGAPARTEVTFDVTKILFGRTVRGILGGDSIPDMFIPKLVEQYLSGRFPLDRLVTFYPLEQINQAAADSVGGAVIKPVLCIEPR